MASRMVSMTRLVARQNVISSQERFGLRVSATNFTALEMDHLGPVRIHAIQ
jgi:hypothetical protein